MQNILEAMIVVAARELKTRIEFRLESESIEDHTDRFFAKLETYRAIGITSPVRLEKLLAAAKEICE